MDDVDGFRAALREGPAGHWLSIPSPQVAEQLALTDADFVVIDTEHTPTSTETVEAMVRAVDAAGAAEPTEPTGTTEPAGTAEDGDGGVSTAAVVRVAWNDHIRIKRVLDTGAAGVMAPRVQTVEEAEAFVEAARYPPEGRRGIAAARASDYGRNFEDYYGEANDRVATIAQIETGAAAERAGDISAVDGLDALLVGPADLSADLDVFGEYDAEPFVAAVEETLEHSEVPVGTLATSPEEVEHWAALGFDYQIVGIDAGYLASGADASLERYADASREN